MIKEICYSGEENKKKLIDGKVEEKINLAMEKCKPEDKIIKFEGKITITNMNYKKGALSQKPYVVPNYQEIKTTQVFKRVLYPYVTNGIPVKALNPKGKTKDFILRFSLDLMKIYLCKPKLNVVPPKSKYTLSTPLCTLVKGHGTPEFSKTGGIFSKPPDKSLCFSIIHKGGTEKHLNIICDSAKECEKIYGCFEVAIYYLKSQVGKAEKGKLCERNRFLYSLTQ
jgi:hypothetical protein